MFEPASDEWTQTATLTPDDGDGGDRFGNTVALDGDRALVGAPRDEDPNGGGSTYVFESSGSGWTQGAKLAAEDGDSDDGFGGSLALDGDRVLVGANRDEDPNGPKAGSVYVFGRDVSTPTETPTPTPTSTPTETPAHTRSPTPTGADTAAETTAEDGPGFGVLTAVTGVAGWLWWRRR